MTRWRTRNRRRRRALEGPKIKGLSWSDCWSSNPLEDIREMQRILRQAHIRLISRKGNPMDTTSNRAHNMTVLMKDALVSLLIGILIEIIRTSRLQHEPSIFEATVVTDRGFSFLLTSQLVETILRVYGII